MLTQNRVKELLIYDSESGVFTWKVNRGTAKAGNIAGDINGGYRRIKIDGKNYQEHRIAWLYVYGEMPTKDIDHIDQNKTNNKISNLRLATPSENQQNISCRKKKSGLPVGVAFNKQARKFQAQIMANGKSIYLGLFNTIEEAFSAYQKAKFLLHPFSYQHII